MPNTLTVGQLIRQLQTADPDLPVYLAINPDWPFSHRTGQVVAFPGAGSGAVYIAENGQEEYLPPAVRHELEWASA